MNNRPYLLSLASYTQGVDEYIKTLSNLSFSVDIVSVEFSPHFPRISAQIRKKIPVNYPGHLGRFLFLGYLMEHGLNLDEDRYWIFTDTGDVVFQKPVPDLTGCADIILTAENVLHKDNEWWAQMARNYPYFEQLLDKPVYNMGTVCMKGKLFKQFIYDLAEFAHQEGIDPTFDQAYFNIWLGYRTESKQVFPEFMSTLYDNLDKEVFLKDGKYYYKDKLISILHKNGSTKNF